MQNEIMNAVVRRLEELFGGAYKVFTKAEQQEVPYFLVELLKIDEKQMLGVRSQRTYHMRVQFVPEEKQPSRELNEIAEQLMEEMEDITLTDGSLMRGSRRSCELSEGSVKFLISFSAFFIRKREDAETMEKLDVEERVK